MEYNYEFWYDVATYDNTNWKGNFTPKEIAMNAFEYWCEWKATLDSDKVTANLDTLMQQLHEDYCNGSVEAIKLLEAIVDELKYQGIEWFID